MIKMESTAKRLDPIAEEVLDYTDKWGQASAADHFRVTLIPFRKWLCRVAGDEDFGKYPKFVGCPEKIYELVLAKIREHRAKDREQVTQMDTLRQENERLREENHQLRQLLYKRFGQTMLNIIEELENE